MCWRSSASSCKYETDKNGKMSSRYRCEKAVCKTCVDLDYQLYADTGTPKEILFLYEKPGYRRISTSVYALEASSKLGCKLCSVILDGIKNVLEMREIREDFASSWNSGQLDVVLQRAGAIEVYHTSLEIKFYSHQGNYSMDHILG